MRLRPRGIVLSGLVALGCGAGADASTPRDYPIRLRPEIVQKNAPPQEALSSGIVVALPARWIPVEDVVDPAKVDAQMLTSDLLVVLNRGRASLLTYRWEAARAPELIQARLIERPISPDARLGVAPSGSAIIVDVTGSAVMLGASVAFDSLIASRPGLESACLTRRGTFVSAIPVDDEPPLHVLDAGTATPVGERHEQLDQLSRGVVSRGIVLCDSANDRVAVAWRLQGQIESFGAQTLSLEWRRSVEPFHAPVLRVSGLGVGVRSPDGGEVSEIVGAWIDRSTIVAAVSQRMHTSSSPIVGSTVLHYLDSQSGRTIRTARVPSPWHPIAATADCVALMRHSSPVGLGISCNIDR